MPRQNPSAEEHCVIPSDNYKKDFALRLFFWTDVFLDYGIKQCKSWARLWFFFLCFSILDTMLYLFFQTKATLNRWASKWSSILNSHSLSLITFKVQKIQTKTNRQINLPFFFQSLWKKNMLNKAVKSLWPLVCLLARCYCFTLPFVIYKPQVEVSIVMYNGAVYHQHDSHMRAVSLCCRVDLWKPFLWIFFFTITDKSEELSHFFWHKISQEQKRSISIWIMIYV